MSKFSLSLNKHHAKKKSGGLEVELLVFLDLRTQGGWVMGLISFTAHSTHRTGEWVDPRAGLEAEKYLFLL
jgi:hypothetical protein